MRQRGHILLLLMMVLAALLAAGTVFLSQLQVNIDGRRTSDVRTQALWLARSAATAGASGVKQVDTPAGTAVVTVRRQTSGVAVQVVLAGATAEVTTSPPAQRFRAAEPDDAPSAPDPQPAR